MLMCRLPVGPHAGVYHQRYLQGSGVLHQGENFGSRRVQEVIDRILNAANQRGMPVGYYCNSGREAEARSKQGFRMLNVGNDMGILTIGLYRALKEARGG